MTQTTCTVLSRADHITSNCRCRMTPYNDYLDTQSRHMVDLSWSVFVCTQVRRFVFYFTADGFSRRSDRASRAFS